MIDTRPVILDIDTQHDALMRHAVFPHPPRSPGYRLWKMLHTRAGVTRSQYVHAFDRRNLAIGAAGRHHPEKNFAVLHPNLVGRIVLLLGDEVRRIVGVPKELILPTMWNGVTYRQIPHPKESCYWYRDASCAALAAMVLEELYERGAAR